jgi:hypothetical protein
MRSALIARAAENMGWQVTLGERFDTQPDVLYVGKIGGHRINIRGPVWLRYIEKLSVTRCRVIIDYTDHYCGFEGVMTDFYKKALKYADMLVTPSATMTSMIRQGWSGAVVEIPDPCEIEPQAPRAPGPGPWRALWFGSCTNVRYLTDFLTDQKNRDLLRQINIVTDDVGSKLMRKWFWTNESSVHLLTLKFFAWSVKNLHEAAKNSDIVVIPSDPSDPRKAGVSENRLITAINLGLVTVASPMPSYQPFRDFFIEMSTKWPENLNSLKKAPDLGAAPLLFIKDRFDRCRLMEKWHETLTRSSFQGSAIGALIKTDGDTCHG